MAKLNLRDKIINNMLFGKGKDSCKALAVYLDKTEEDNFVHPLVALQFNIIRTSESTFIAKADPYVYDALDDTCKVSKISDEKKTSVITIHENSKNENMECNMNVHIVYESTEDADYIKYEYTTEFKTDIGNNTEEIQMLNAEHSLVDKDKDEKAHIIIIILPMSKMVPIVVDLISPEYRYNSNGNILQDNIYSDAKTIINKMAFITGEKSDPMYSIINFNSYTESFNTNSYQIKRMGSFENIKDRTFEDRYNELRYLTFDSFKKIDNDNIRYVNEKTHISYRLEKKDEITYFIYAINNIKFFMSRYTDDGNFKEVVREGKYKNGKAISYSDYGYDDSLRSIYDEDPHMKRIKSESEFTEDELEMINHCEFERIEYENEFPYTGKNAIAIKEEDEIEDITKYYSCLFPYIWVDEDNTGKVNKRAVELFGIYPRENNQVANISILILDESVMIIESGYSEGTTSHLYTQIFLKEDIDNPAYSCHKIVEMNLYASNTITECDFGDNYKFRITERTNTDISGKQTGSLYSYESPELNIIVDRLNNKIVDFTSSVYNRYFDDVVLVRDMYGCQQELKIRKLR